jgi:hypothetical protein
VLCVGEQADAEREHADYTDGENHRGLKYLAESGPLDLVENF